MNTVRKIGIVQPEDRTGIPLGLLAHLAGQRVFIFYVQGDRAYVNYRTETGDYAKGWVRKAILRLQ